MSEAKGAHKIYNATVHCLITKSGKKYVVEIQCSYAEKCFRWQQKFGLNVKFLWALKILKDNGLSRGHEKKWS